MVFRLAGDHAGAAHRLTVVEDRVEDLSAAFDDLEGALTAAATSAQAHDDVRDGADVDETGPGGGGGGGRASAEDGGLDMRQLVAWVRDNVALLLERKVPQTGGAPFWCRRWWLHPEAIARFEAARRCWAEAVSSDSGSAMVIYFEHLDHQLGVLLGESGPFCGCVAGIHKSASSARVLGQDVPDESYFLDFEQTHDPDPWDA